MKHLYVTYLMLFSLSLNCVWICASFLPGLLPYQYNIRQRSTLYMLFIDYASKSCIARLNPCKHTQQVPHKNRHTCAGKRMKNEEKGKLTCNFYSSGPAVKVPREVQVQLETSVAYWTITPAFCTSASNNTQRLNSYNCSTCSKFQKVQFRVCNKMWQLSC